MKIKKIKPFEIFITVIFCIFVSWIKALNGIHFLLVSSMKEFVYNIYVCPVDDLILNVFWSSIIFLQIFIVSKNSYYKLLNFEVRNKNRLNNAITALLDLILHTLIYSIICTIIQYIFIQQFVNLDLGFELEVLQILLKYFIEILVFSLSILYFGVHLENFTYSYIFHLILYFVLLDVCKYSIVPFISLHVNSEINILSIIIGIVLCILINKKCNNIEFLGGIDR